MGGKLIIIPFHRWKISFQVQKPGPPDSQPDLWTGCLEEVWPELSRLLVDRTAPKHNSCFCHS